MFSKRWNIRLSRWCFVVFCFCVQEVQSATLLQTQEEMSRKVIAVYSNNMSSIYFWTGNASVRMKQGMPDQEKLIMAYDVNFAYDLSQDRKAWNISNIQYSSPTNSATVIYEKVFESNGTYYNCSSEKNPNGTNPTHHLSISTQPLVFLKSFNPFDECSPVQSNYILRRFSGTILDERIQKMKEIGRTAEEIRQFTSETQQEGFKSHIFSMDGDILTRQWISDGKCREIIEIDLSKGANPVSLKDFGGGIGKKNSVARSWDATYQEVNGVWVPRTTRTFQRMSDGTCDITEIEWSDQKINEPIPEERFSLKAIGAVRGMDVRDYRINSSYRADSDEFPWPESSAHGGLQRESILRYIFMGAGVLLLLVGGGFAWIRKR